MEYKKCDKCLAHYPDKDGYEHVCDGLMKTLVSHQKNKKTLESFVAYCKSHPDERFWQALRNWSEYNFIYGGMELTDDSKLKDTFYKE